MSRYRRLPIQAWNLRRGNEPTYRALLLAIERARVAGHAHMFQTVDEVTFLAEPWADRDVLRAHLLREVPESSTRFGLVFIRADGHLIEPTRWYVLEVPTGDPVKPTMIRTVAIALSEAYYALLEREGATALYRRALADLRAVGDDGGGEDV